MFSNVMFNVNKKNLGNDFKKQTVLSKVLMIRYLILRKLNVNIDGAYIFQSYTCITDLNELICL
jgi:hypothetical protein